jgi:hypothetical protein
VAIPKGFRHELRELTGFRSIRGIATAGYACLAMTEMFYAVPLNRKINYNLHFPYSTAKECPWQEEKWDLSR